MTDVSIKPVDAHAAHDAHSDAKHEAQRNDSLKFGMWLFLASEVILFTVLIATFLVWRVNNGELVHQVHEATGVFLVSVNTFLLLASSFAMVMGLRQIQLNNTGGLIKWIGLTALLGAIFVGLQGVEYTILSNEGITIYSSEFGMRFYAPTAMHGAHVIFGVIWALYVVMNARRGKYSSKNNIGVEIFGLYWHFVDVVWILLFTVIYLL
ncbi:MAG: cytochrome c oxidase subunit III [Chloroflexi bacterium OLB15]|nr:MAG: cytochrome c oxidase subunit III [Chloroflexi bacterium OLB15]